MISVQVGPFNERTSFRMPHVRIDLPRLPEAFDGLRLALVTDLHFGPINRAGYARKALAAAAEAGDVVLLGGDMVDRGHSAAPALAHVLAPVAERAEMIAVLGNHEYYCGRRRFLDSLADAGVEVLVNRHRLLHRDGASLALVGLDDFVRGQPDLTAACEGLDEDTTRIVLAHNPDTADWVSRDIGVELMLSGHTHAGQVRLGNVPLVTQTCKIGRAHV